jgi:glycosyltransferase involved in cell wall biosynthesis
MEKQALITVIVPVYNTAQYLKKCVDSILAQTWNNLEVFLVDDGSTDNSAAIIRGYQEKYPEVIKSIFQNNAGQGFARNAALDLMTGDFITFVDSDDWILPEMFTAMLKNLNETKSDIVSCDY